MPFSSFLFFNQPFGMTCRRCWGVCCTLSSVACWRDQFPFFLESRFAAGKDVFFTLFSRNSWCWWASSPLRGCPMFFVEGGFFFFLFWRLLEAVFSFFPVHLSLRTEGGRLFFFFFRRRFFSKRGRQRKLALFYTERRVGMRFPPFFSV